MIATRAELRARRILLLVAGMLAACAVLAGLGRLGLRVQVDATLSSRHGPFHPILYLPLAVLHVGLLARVTGDLAGLAQCRIWGGLGNAAALLLFPPAALWARYVERRKSDAQSPSTRGVVSASK